MRAALILAFSALFVSTFVAIPAQCQESTSIFPVCKQRRGRGNGGVLDPQYAGRAHRRQPVPAIHLRSGRCSVGIAE